MRQAMPPLHSALSLSESERASERASKLRRQRFFNYTSPRQSVRRSRSSRRALPPLPPSTRELLVLSWLWSGV